MICAVIWKASEKKTGDFCIRRLGMSRVQYVLRMLVKWFFVNANNLGRFTTQCVKRHVDSNTMPMAPLSAMVVIFFRIACSKIPVGTFRMYLKTNRLRTLRWPLTWTIPWMRVRLLVNSMRSSSLTVEKLNQQQNTYETTATNRKWNSDKYHSKLDDVKHRSFPGDIPYRIKQQKGSNKCVHYLLLWARARVCVCLHCATVDKQYFSPIARKRKTAVFLSFQHTTNNKTHLQTNGGKKCTYNEEAVARIKYNISSHLKICNCFKRKECTHTHTLHYTLIITIYYL